jgi:hypothetical protein
MIKIDGTRFVDESGRTLLLRGVNLGGSSKVPFAPDGATCKRERFYQHRAVSFVGRPFPLAEAHEHFARLRAWGFTFLRLLVTWEAVEHAGPGHYDEDYLDYLHAVVELAGQHGLDLFIDPHQDVWSRFTGGDGAPGWTLEAAGFDLANLHASGAAFLHQECGDPFLRMIWPTNYHKLAAATMFTLFFGGDDFAPLLKVDGTPVQEYLQGHYIEAMVRVARALRGLPNVVGYGTLNEPSKGFIGEADVRRHAGGLPLRVGDAPTIFQGMLLGSGYPQQVEVYATGLGGIRKTGTRLANPGGVRAWSPGRECLWSQHGVWGLGAAGEPAALKPDYFKGVDGREVDFYRDYFKPFANRYARALRAVAPGALVFVEGLPTSHALTWGPSDAADVAHAAHWYDYMTLFTKSFPGWMTVDTRSGKLVLGARRVRTLFVEQVAQVMRQSEGRMGAPTLIGEVGIPFDMGGKRAYRSGDFSTQVRALDATMAALERNLVNFTLWNYTADNTNARGDGWNDEDLSLFSRDQMAGSGSIHDGGRALEAAVRPYPCRVAGEPLSLAFDLKSKTFEFTFRHAGEVEAPTELFVPELQYPRGYTVEVSDGTFEAGRAPQTLLYRHTREREVHSLRLRPKGQLARSKK